jgi:hypothetical protein
VLLAAAVAILNVSLTFGNVWPTLRVRLTSALSIEAALCVLLIVAASRWRGPLSRLTLRRLAAVWVALVVGHYVDVTARSLYGREINLYWDVRYVPTVSGNLAYVAEPHLIVLVIVAAVLLPLLIYLPLRWALGCVADAAGDARARVLLGTFAGLVLLLGIVQALSAPAAEVLPVTVAEPVTAVYARQAGQFAYEMSGAGVRALPPAPAIRSDLANVKGADVFVIFIESYGTVSWDRQDLVQALAPSRARLDADIRGTGRRVVSALVESTTFGGESWLAHISLLSGTEIRDQDSNVRLMAQRRETMVSLFRRQGYRTIVMMPGLQRAWPEGAFYGFDAVYGVDRLGYHGPPFGWWDITDQFVLARMDASEIAPKERRPVFVFFPTISTHTPFTPTPPYQPDWARMLTPAPYDTAALDRAWSQPPDWLNLGPGYAQALDYIYASLGGYLRLRADRDFVMVLVGDHQPPAMVSGEGAPWDVPVHVVASRQAVLDRLLQQGFRAGLQPPHPSIAKMNGLLPILLKAFGSDSRLPQHRDGVASKSARTTKDIS